MMQRCSHELVGMVVVRLVPVDDLEHLEIGCLQLVIVIWQRACQAKHIHVGVGNGCTDRILTVEYLVNFLEVVLLYALEQH